MASGIKLSPEAGRMFHVAVAACPAKRFSEAWVTPWPPEESMPSPARLPGLSTIGGLPEFGQGFASGEKITIHYKKKEQ